MLNICAIVGSNSKNSNTLYFTKKFLNELEKKIDINLNIKIYHLHNYNIKTCNGCLMCSKVGKCYLPDDMDFLKSEMISSDLIIWASPVYVNNVSGVMKNFIDRISDWTHIMRLAGKTGIVISTTSHGGDIYVRDYLKSILWNMGVVTLADYNMCVDFPQELYSGEKEKILIEKYTSDVINLIKNNKLEATLMHEFIFNSLKNMVNSVMKTDAKNLSAEVKFWKENDMINFNTFQELVDSIIKGSITLK